MKIAVDVSQMCYEGTGVARYVAGLTRAILKTDSQHQFTLYAGALKQKSFFDHLKTLKPWNRATWKIFPLPPKLAGLALNSLNLPFELLTGSVDLIHFSDWSEPYTRVPSITTVHDLVFHKYPTTVDPLIRSTQAKRLARLVNDRTHILADSQSTKNDLMEIYHLPAARITVIYPGISPDYQPQSKKEIERVKIKYHLPEKFIFSLGTQEPRKNLAKLVEATRDLELPLILAGKYGWGEQTRSIGFIEDADLPAVYSAATVFAYPSLYEGFGFPVLEAMACGTPVVTSNVSSLPEVAGEAAILVDPASVDSIKAGIIKALKNREKLITAGFLQAKQFTWEKTAKQTLEVYEKIANRH